MCTSFFVLSTTYFRIVLNTNEKCAKLVPKGPSLESQILLFMIKTLLFAFCFSIILSVQAQVLPDFHLVEAPCPGDTTSIIYTFANWEVYQTEDDTWYGPRVPACIEVSSVNWNAHIMTENLLPDKAIFIRCKLDESNKILLLENSVYQLEYDFKSFVANNALDTTFACPGGMCTGVGMGIQIPDSTGTGFDKRWYKSPTKNFFLQGSIYQDYISNSCIPTEKFIGGNYLTDFYLSVKPLALAANDYIQLNAGAEYNFRELYDFGEYYTLSEQELNDWVSFDNDVDFAALSGWLEFGVDYFIYEDTTYPSNDHWSYYDLHPTPNTADPQNINLILNYDISLVFQPFTAVRGDLVAGSDSIRHEVNIINNGSDFCMGGWLEVLLSENVEYRHYNGHFDFGSPRACVQIGKGGSFKVMEGSKLYYGNNGLGMMLWRTGGKMTLEKNAQLYIDNLLMMADYAGESPGQRLYLTLSEGNVLRFGPHAHLSNASSHDPNLKLYVFMKGGFLDDSQLPEEDRALIVRVYDEQPGTYDDNIALLKNPISDELVWQWISDENLHYDSEVFGLDGRLISKKQGVVETGQNTFSFDTRSLPAGMYVIYVRTDKGIGKKLFCKG